MTYPLLTVALILACSWLAWELGCEKSVSEELGRKLCSAEILIGRMKYGKESAEQPKEEWKEWLEEV